MKQTTKQQILSYLEGQDWCSGSQLELMSMEWQTKPSTVSRRLRELYEDGQLDRKLVKGCVWYKKRPFKTRLMEAGRAVSISRPNQLFETAPPRFTMDPLTKKAK